MGRARRVLARHPLPGFLVVAFAGAWAWDLLVLAVLGFGMVATLPSTFLGPTAAALAVTHAREGRDGVCRLLRRCVAWRVPARWHAVALLGPPAVLAVAMLPVPGAIAGATAPGVGFLLGHIGITAFILLLGGPLGEEPGWRGVALPLLRHRLSPVSASLVLGVVHGLWHLPLYALVPGYNEAPGDPAGIAAALGSYVLVQVPAGAVVFTWLLARSGGSLLPVMLLHASNNTAMALVARVLPAADPADARLARMLASVGVAAVLVLATRGRLGHASRDRVAECG